MTTPRELITGALRLINVVQANEVPTASDMDISFEALNGMLDSWSNEKLSIFTMNPYVFQFAAGQKEYTLGVGGDWDTPRPMDLQMMYVMYLDGGGACPIPPAPPVSLYQNYGFFTVRNGYDGDVGIYGYVSQSNPFYSPFEIEFVNTPQTTPDINASYLLLTTGHDPSPYLTMGIGNDTDVPGGVAPAIVGTNRNLTVPIDQYWQRSYYLPMRATDKLWCTSTIFAGYAQSFIVTVVVGPDPYNGEQYICSGNGTGYGIATIDLERLADVGIR